MARTESRLSRAELMPVGFLSITPTACHAADNMFTSQNMFAEYRHADTRASGVPPAGAHAPIEEIHMQSRNRGERYMSMKEIESTAGWRGTMRPTLKVAMEGWAGPGILTLLFLASLAYVASGGTFAFEASSALESETSIAEVAVNPADAGGASREDQAAVENVVVRCDKAAVVNSDRVYVHGDHGRDWRRERQLAFRRCMDESFQRSQKQRY